MDTVKEFLEFQYERIEVLSEKKHIDLVKDQLSGRILVRRELPCSMAVLYDSLKPIHHKNLVQVMEVHVLTDTCIVIEEYVNGINMDELLKRDGRFTKTVAVRYIEELSEALKELHDRGLVHRDVNMSNIRITSNGVLKLMDFDAMRQVKENTSKDTVLLGTVGYAAPEQFGFYESDNRTDIYAVGVLLNQMLTGRLPAESPYTGDKVVERVIAGCIQLDKHKRYKRVEQVVRELVSGQKGYYAQKLYSQLPGLRTDKWYYKAVAFLGYLFFLCALLSLGIAYKKQVRSFLDYMIAVVVITIEICIPAVLFSNVADCDIRILKLSRFSKSTRIFLRCLVGYVFYLIGYIMTSALL